MRARVTLLFSLAGLLLAAALALLTYSLARNQLSSQRDDVAVRQAFLNARLVRDLLRTKRVSHSDVIREVRPDSGGAAL